MHFTGQLRRFFVLFLLLCSSSYGENQASAMDVARFLGGAFFPEKNLTIQEGGKWYSENKENLMKLHDLVLKHPIIRRVDPGMSFQYVPNSEKFTSEDLSAYKTMEEECKSLNIKNIAVSRKSNVPSGRLLSVGYTLSSSGLSVSGGRSLSVRFIPDEDYLWKDTEHIEIPLEEKGWYIVDRKDGRK